MEQPTVPAPLNPSEPTQVVPPDISGPTLPAPSASRATPAPDPRDRAGHPFGRYRLLDEIGRGGMGVVWRAWDTNLRREVALKQILVRERGEEAYVQRFVREAQLAARLRHPGIVAVHDVGVHQGQHFFTTDFIPGRSLEHAMGDGVPLRRAVEWVRDVAEALAYAHGQGIVHRDVKPENLLVDGDGRIYVTDFGLAKAVDLGPEAAGSRLTAVGSIVGTPQYMSPEQASGQTEGLTPATDQFSLGVVLYELLTKRLPFHGKGLRDLLNAITEAEPPPLRKLVPSIPGDLETVCLKALAKRPGERYAATGDFAADLRRFLDGEPIRARPLSALGAALRGAARHRVAALAVVAAVALVTGVASWAIVEAGRRERQVAADRDARDKADRELREALELMERGRSVYDRAARCLYQETTADEEAAQIVDEGITLLAQASAKVPDRALPHLLLGRAWELKGREDQAEGEYREAIRREPTFGPVRWQLGRLLILRAFRTKIGSATISEAGQKALDDEVQRIIADASREFEAAFREPLGWGEERGLSELLARAMGVHMAGDFAKARELCREATRGERREGLEEFYWILGCASAGQDRLEALSIAIEIRPKYAVALMCRGTERHRQGAYVGALEDFDQALRINPRLFDARMCRGMTRLATGEAVAALEDFDAFLRESPRHMFAMNVRAQALQQSGDVAGAIEAFTEAAAIDPSFVDPILNRGSAKFQNGDMKGGLEDLAEGLRRAPVEYALRETWEKALYDGLAVAFRRAPEVLPKWVVAAMEGTEAIGTVDYPRARTRYQEALRLGAAGAHGDVAMRRLVHTVHYNLACIESLLSIGKDGPKAAARGVAEDAAEVHRAAAFAHLRSSIELGVPPEQARDDEDFAPLHGDSRWAELFTK